MVTPSVEIIQGISDSVATMAASGCYCDSLEMTKVFKRFCSNILLILSFYLSTDKAETKQIYLALLLKLIKERSESFEGSPQAYAFLKYIKDSVQIVKNTKITVTSI